MGVPALFRWLAAKYPKIVVPVVDDTPSDYHPSQGQASGGADHAGDGGGEEPPDRPFDLLSPNPNGIEYDNLYLDMNGIIHPCCHPEHRKPPETEAEMMQAIFAYTDHIFAMIRPRRLLYLAIDGVAPRAKMNQQRARRFRAAQEAEAKAREQEDASDDESFVVKGAFDSNCITPGTPFMANVARAMRFYVQERISREPAWQRIKVILSDSNVPGEGEHKIVDYIRRQRVAGLESRLKASEEALSSGGDAAVPVYDPNATHVIYGLDADLIMLSMATHEPRFSVLREDVFAQEAESRAQTCRRCKQPGHFVKDCPVSVADDEGGWEKKPFIFLRIDILREYLQIEMSPTDLERAIDDWIFLCFFVGNDFLPHLPSLEIREGAIDILIDIYKRVRLGGYICNGGHVDMGRAETVMRELGRIEPGIFRKRHDKEERRRANEARRKAQDRLQEAEGTLKLNQTAAQLIRAEQERASTGGDYAATPSKRPAPGDGDEQAGRGEALPVPHDEIRFHEPGAKERYYRAKLHDESLVASVVKSYVQGLAWVMRYYYQGCPSWSWYYPFHYAPFASDLCDIDRIRIDFELGKPFRPFDQLMAVFPAASQSHVPEPFRHLMTNADSELIDFYPTTFPVDMNGKRHAWQGVALLPFIDEDRLLAAVEAVYPRLSADDLERNVLGVDNLYAHEHLPVNDIFGEAFVDGAEGRSMHDALVQTPYGSIRRCSAIAYVYSVPFHGRHDIGYLYDLFPGCKPPPTALSEDEIRVVARGDAAKRFQNILGYKTRAELAVENSPSSTSRSSYPSSSANEYRLSAAASEYRPADPAASYHYQPSYYPLAGRAGGHPPPHYDYRQQPASSSYAYDQSRQFYAGSYYGQGSSYYGQGSSYYGQGSSYSSQQQQPYVARDYRSQEPLHRGAEQGYDRRSGEQHNRGSSRQPRDGGDRGRE